jgi:solute:Na+ symporter, SSS family
MVYAVYNCFGWAPIVTGYMTGWIVMELKPILGWSRFEIVLACAILVMISTVLSGLLGVAHAQIFQFCLYLAGAACLLPAMVGYFGGWHQTVSTAIAARGAQVMDPLPPSSSLTPLVVLALIIQGFFFAANPTAGEGSTAQRFMAAKNETHAALGQMLSALFALAVRVLPFIGYGIVAIALFPKGSIAPEQLWAQLVLKFAPPGLRGLVIAAELAGYMAIANAYMNWGSSFITNDIYKRFLRPNASGRQLATVGRLTTLVMVCLSFLVAFFLVNQMMSWFLYINAVMIAFVLPLAWLRFFWWRLNIWGEAAGVLLGLPLGYLIWFSMGFSRRPFWFAFFVLFGTGWVVILLATLLTRPESKATLERFYQRCRPAGYWSPVTSALGKEAVLTVRREFRKDLADCFVGIVVCGSIVILLNAIVAQSWGLVAGTAFTLIISSTVFIRRWRSAVPG